MNPSRRRLACFVALAAVAVAGPVCASIRLSAATRERDSSLKSLEEASRLALSVEAMERSRPWGLDKSLPPADMTPRLLRALEVAGVPKDRLKSVRQSASKQPSPQTASDVDSIRQRTVAVSIEPLTFSEIGSILGAWREIEPHWIVSMIDIKHAPGSARRGSLRLDLTRTYITQGTVTPRKGGRA